MFKTLNSKLRFAFNRKAQSATSVVPKDILHDKQVRKAIIKSQRKKWLRRFRNMLFTSVALSTVLQFTPGLVSTKFDDFMAAKGHASDYSQHFHSREIRVYDRSNILYPFHLAGKKVGNAWHDELKVQVPNVIGLSAYTPFIYAVSLWKGFADIVPVGNRLDAFSMSTSGVPSDRENYIRPPGDFSLNRYLYDFSGLDGRGFNFVHERKELEHVIFEFIMLHEARHGDQDKSAYITANESDADLYALEVLAGRGADRALLHEAITIVENTRIVNAAVWGDHAHITSPALQRGWQRIIDAHQDAASFSLLKGIFDEAHLRNITSFHAGMPMITRYFYLAHALSREGILLNDASMEYAANSFINAVNYFDRLSEGRLVDHGFDLDSVNLSYLTVRYKPTPDRLPRGPSGQLRQIGVS